MSQKAVLKEKTVLLEVVYGENVNRMNINLHIERLVLNGLPIEGGQASHVQAAVEAELTHLITENGLAPYLQSDGAIPRLNTNSIQLAQGITPIHLGKQIAKSLFTGIGVER